MFPFPGYHPHNYKPGQATNDPPPIPDAIKQRAKDQGAEYIHRNGEVAYKWHYQRLLEAYAPDSPSWYEHQGPELPAGELLPLP